MKFLFVFLSSLILINSRLDQINRQIQILEAQTQILTNISINYSHLGTYRFPSNTIFLCQIAKGVNATIYPIQTLQKIYFLISQTNEIRIYNKCQLVVTIYNVSVVDTICDRGHCQQPLFIGSDYNLYILKEQRIYNLGKVSDFNSYVKGISRVRKQHKLEIFIFERTAVKIYDEIGIQKMTIPLHQIKNVAQHHPHPILLLDDNWLSFFDTSRLIQVTSECPYFGKIKTILTDASYEDKVIIVKQKQVLVLEILRKGCDVKYGFISNLGNKNIIQNNKKQKIQKIKSIEKKINLYKDVVVFSQFIYNSTEKIIYKNDPQIIIAKRRLFKNNALIIESQCKKKQCKYIIREQQKKSNQKSVLLWFIMGSAILIFLAVRCINKKRTFSYQQIIIKQE